MERLKAFRAARDGAAAEASLAALTEAAGEERNLMPAILGAVKAEATLGEISDRLREVYGEHRDTAFT